MYDMRMRKSIDPRKNFTTTLLDPLLHELDRAAKELGVRKNDILVEATTAWNKKRKQALLAESYARTTSNSRESISRTADEGLEDFYPESSGSF